MAQDDARAIGRRIKKFREDKGMSASALAEAARISRSYLSELEGGKGEHKRPSADVVYRVGKALGISMSELLGKPLITESANKPPASLARFAKEHRIPKSDVEMLSSIKFRGETPQTSERWAFIYNAIKTSASMDERRRR